MEKNNRNRMQQVLKTQTLLVNSLNVVNNLVGVDVAEIRRE